MKVGVAPPYFFPQAPATATRWRSLCNLRPWLRRFHNPAHNLASPFRQRARNCTLASYTSANSATSGSNSGRLRTKKVEHQGLTVEQMFDVHQRHGEPQLVQPGRTGFVRRCATILIEPGLEQFILDRHATHDNAVTGAIVADGRRLASTSPISNPRCVRSTTRAARG